MVDTSWTKSSGTATTWTKGSAVNNDWTQRDTTSIVNLGAKMDDTVYLMDDTVCTMDDLKLNTQVAQGTTWTKT